MKPNVRIAIVLAIYTVIAVLSVVFIYTKKQKAETRVAELKIELEECKLEAEQQREVAIIAQKEAKAQAALANKIMEDKLNMEDRLNNKK